MSKLSKSVADRATYTGDGKARCVVWDDGNGSVPGFGLRVYPPGKDGTSRKSFVFSYRTGGRKRLMTIGAFGTMTADQARDRARKHHVDVGAGADPLAAKKKASARGKGLAELIDQYVNDYAIGAGGKSRPHKRTWQKDKRRLEIHVVPVWKSKRPRDIGAEDVASLYNRLASEKPYEANRLHENLRKLFDLARGWQYLDQDAINPAKAAVSMGLMSRFKERERKVWLRPSQMPYLARAIDQEESIYVRSIFLLFMLTGLRHTELLRARRDQVQWDTGQLMLPETKSGEIQFATLNGPALAILQALPHESGNPYLFPSDRKKGQPINNINKAWARIKDRATVYLWEAYEHDERVPALVMRLRADLDRYPTIAECRAAATDAEIELSRGVEQVRIHDLRRSTGSWLTAAGVDLNQIKQALRHARISTTLRYAQLADDAARPAMEEHGRRVMEAAGKIGPVGVVGQGN